MKIRTALLSVSDKTGIVELAQALRAQQVRIISTGGTKDVLQKAGIAVTDITEVTGNPEAFGGRMKTISFQVASGILFDRTRDKDEAEKLKILPIDLVVANLYPFAEYKEKGLSLEELIEYIDVGGPTMIRAAAKNFQHVAVLTRPEDYPGFIAELGEKAGAVSVESRKRWMRTAFHATATYDTMIAEHLAGEKLRYGENPHQSATFTPDPSGISFDVLAGKELSYNNLVDLDAALAAALPLAHPTCAIIKHENPCGLASSENLGETLERAWGGDPVSAFGSVIAFNRKVNESDLKFLGMDQKETRRFVEIVAAPDLTDEAVAYLKQNKNLRVLRIRDQRTGPKKTRRMLSTGTLVQDADEIFTEKLDVVSAKKPEKLDEDLLRFGVHAVRCLKSNAIALVRRHGTGMELLGMGAGQPNRVKSTELAISQAQANLRMEAQAQKVADVDAYVRQGLGSAYLISDAFFPFADSVEHAIEAGVRTVVEPGGSLRDPDVIKVCDASGVVLVFTGTRHFKH